MNTLPTSELAKSIAAQAVEGKSMKEMAVGRSDMFRMNPYSLTIRDGWNSREQSAENDEHIDNLARSIAVHGVMEPLTAFSDGKQIIVSDGHCRLLATYRAIEVYGAEILSIPVKTEPKGASDADRLLSQIIRNSGKPLSALEQATVVKKLMAFGWTPEQIAQKMAVTLAKVNSLLDLHATPDAVKSLINAGKVSPTLALATVKKQGDAQAVQTLQGAVAVAEASGKAKATAKDTGAQSLRKLMQEAFDSAHIDENDFDDRVQIMMKRSDFDKIKAELKL
jgi:ParB/RepB/Spo0J family partition protein